MCFALAPAIQSIQQQPFPHMGIEEIMQNDTMFLKQGNGVFHLKQPTEVTKIIAKQNTIQNYWLFSRQFKKKKCLLDSLVKKKKKKGNQAIY